MEQCSILVSCKYGWAFDHCKAISDSVHGSGFKCPCHLFNRSVPYNCLPRREADDRNLNDSVGKIKGEKTEDVFINKGEKSNRKRKIAKNKSCTDDVMNDLDNANGLEREAVEIIELMRKFDFQWNIDKSPKALLHSPQPIQDAIDFVGLSTLAKDCKSFDECTEVTCLPIGEAFSDIISNILRNSHQSCVFINTLGAKFIIPPNCMFLMSDVEDIGKLLNQEQKYNLIIMDPPWHNKSVKRAKCYNSLTFNTIKTLPIPNVALSGCLVAVWVTNKKKVIDFVKEELFPFWSLEFVGEWNWVKVTTKGDFVCDFQSSHKKPYETILIGCYHESVNHVNPETSSQCNLNSTVIPFHKIFCSVPCSLHSRKPILYDMLKSYLPVNHKCLELFARNLLPGWTSWGNEVLKYQNLIYFEKSC